MNAHLGTVSSCKRCSSRRRTHLGWVVRGVSSHELTRVPRASVRSSCAGAIGGSDLRSADADPLLVSRSPKIRLIERRRWKRSRAVRTRHAPSRSLFDAVFRYAITDIHDLSQANRRKSSFLSFFAWQRSWVHLCPSQACSRGWVVRHFCRSGPTCLFDAARPGPIDFRRA